MLTFYQFFINIKGAMKTPMSIQKLLDFFIHNRIRLITILVLLLLIEDILEGIHPHDIDSFRDPWGNTGLIFVLLGVFLRSWAAGTIHKNKKLADQGPYGIMRHPLYAGSFLMFIGFSIIIGDNENILFVLITFFLFYLPAIRKEERKLRRYFGREWFTYIERTSMFFPKKLPGNLLSNWSFTQWLKNHEYRACVSSLIALIILELIHEVHLY